MSRKNKSGSVAVQSSAEVEKQVSQVEVVTPIEKPVEPSRHSCQCAASRERMLFDIYVAKVASVDTGKVLTSRTSNVYESLFKEAEIALDVYLNQTKQEK